MNVLDDVNATVNDYKNYLTENPLTKALNGFPLKMHEYQIE